MNEIIVRPDAKGKINLGELAKGVSSFRATLGENHKIILEPYTEITFDEKILLDELKKKQNGKDA